MKNTLTKDWTVGDFRLEVRVGFRDHKHRGLEPSVYVSLSKNMFHIAEVAMVEPFSPLAARECIENVFQDPYATILAKYGKEFDVGAVLRLMTPELCN